MHLLAVSTVLFLLFAFIFAIETDTSDSITPGRVFIKRMDLSSLSNQWGNWQKVREYLPGTFHTILQDRKSLYS